MAGTCATCGNPTDDSICPYCGDFERVEAASSRIVTWDVGHRGWPAHEANRRFMAQVDEVRASGARLLVVVTGYGSTGRGGAIRSAVLAACHRLQATGVVGAFVSGDELHAGSNRGRDFANAYPEVRDSRVWGSGNEGTVVVGL